jgi:anti-anti-sigma regulatory factor
MREGASAGGGQHTVSFGLRSHTWGPLLIIVVSGRVDVESAVQLGSEIRRLQRERNVVVDLWDVTELHEVGVFVLTAAKRQAKGSGWGFAVVADPMGACVKAIEDAGATDTLRPFASRRQARQALQTASP